MTLEARGYHVPAVKDGGLCQVRVILSSPNAQRPSREGTVLEMAWFSRSGQLAQHVLVLNLVLGEAHALGRGSTT